MIRRRLQFGVSAASLLFLLLPWMEPASGAAVALEPITVTAHELDGVDRRDWPLTFTAPFPPATLRDGDSIRIRDEDGDVLATQARAFRKWRDGSVRWMLIDTRVSLQAHRERRLRIEAGKSPPPAIAVRVTDGPEAVHVDTGALRFDVAKKHFAVLEHLQTGAGVTVSTKGLSSLLTGDGRAGSAGTPARVEVTESGPLRARLEVEGNYGNGFDYLIRLEAYAGQPFVRLWHTFTNVGGGRYKNLSEVTLEMPIAAATKARYTVGVEPGKNLDGAVGEKGVRIYQADNLAYETNGSRHDGHLEGWAALANARAVVGMAGRFFWQEYPKSFDLRRDAIQLHLWPPYASSTPVGMGAAKTHEMVLWAAAPGSLPGSFGRGVADPLVVTLEAGWIVETGALPQAIVPPADGFVPRIVKATRRYLKRNASERWDDRGDVDCKSRQGERPRDGAYGMWNWGDWNFPGYHDDTKGCDAWGNLEYDTTQTLALAFAASGRAELQAAMVSAARHFMDVDTIHFHGPRPSWTGMNHPKNPLHFTFELGGVDLGHTWNEGLLSYYYLTGDERGLETALGIADYLVDRVNGLVVRANPRQWGWPQVALVAAYDATGEGKYLAAASEYAKRGMAAFPVEEVKRWKVGILADGLAYTHSVTHDPQIKEWLEAYAKAVARRKVPLDARFYPGVAYVAAVDQNAQLRRIALAKAKKLKLGSWGKPFSINGRIGFRIYSLLDDGQHAASPQDTGKTKGPSERKAPDEKKAMPDLRVTRSEQ